ncbi:MAG: hypothetical protein K2J20_06655 [Bacilli bacterium]|nr:hypothetical protein [Bacilli bacterium]
MKKKLIIITLLGAIISIIIYFYTRSDEITIVALGDGLSIGMTPYDIEGYSFNDYLKEDYTNKHKLKNYYYEFAQAKCTIKELIYDIKENKSLIIKNEKVEIQRAINEADILTIAIGLDELAGNKITTSIKNEFQDNITELLSMIKMLNHNKVIVLGIYQTTNQDALTIAKINAIIRDVALSNSFTFIDITSLSANSKYFLDKKSHYINYEGHKAIYKEIKKLL